MKERINAFLADFAAPLILGGKVRLGRPLMPDPENWLGVHLPDAVNEERLRVMRQLFPVDSPGDPSVGDWQLTVALHNLLQATNHLLSGALTRARHRRLLNSTIASLKAIAPPRTLHEALVRHSMVRRALDVFRTDTHVRWWSGQADFRGETPPGRLLSMPDLRRVTVTEQRVALQAMADDPNLALPGSPTFHEGLQLWLERSPLTDFTTLARTVPPFRWTPFTLAFLGVPHARNLVLRALSLQPQNRVTLALGRARTASPLGEPFRTWISQLEEDLATRQVHASHPTSSS